MAGYAKSNETDQISITPIKKRTNKSLKPSISLVAKIFLKETIDFIFDFVLAAIWSAASGHETTQKRQAYPIRTLTK